MARQALEYPWPFRVLRKLFPILEKLAPSLAKTLAVRLFLTPIRFPMRDADRRAMKTFHQEQITVGGEDVVVYTKGSGREVLCLHGWSGKAMQFRRIADRLVEAGFCCVLVDAAAHGESSGGQTNIFEFRDAFNAVYEQLKDPVAVVGHSLGAASISLAVADGTKIPAFAIFGAPVVGKDILDEFKRRVNGSDLIADHLRQQAVDVFDRSFESVTMQETFASVDCPCIGFHGHKDQDAPSYHLEVLKKINPSLETHFFDEMGHRRILKDDTVIDVFMEWLKARAAR